MDVTEGGRRASLGRVPSVALVVLAVGLAAHNLVMALLWQAGVRGGALDVVAAWKDVVLLVAVVAALAALGRRPTLVAADRIALLYGALVVVYLVLPQHWLGGAATTRGQFLALRHDLLPLGAYALGRLAPLSRAVWRRLGLTVVAVGLAVAGWGLADVYLVPLDRWRHSGVPGWFREQLGIRYSDCFGGLPENWILNTNDEQNPLRRLTSTFLSPLATAYVLVVVALLLVARRRLDRWSAAAGLLVGAGLFWTHTRAALLALVLGILVLAALQRRPRLVLVAGACLLLSFGFVEAFPTIGPGTSYTASEIACLRALAAGSEAAGGGALSGSDASTTSHWQNLRDGVTTVVHHPQGFGLGNAGVTASRTGVEIRAGESTYTEIGVETGIVGALVLVAWLVAMLLAVARRSAWIGACLVAVAALGIQTDVIGVHWLAVVVFAAAGAVVAARPGEPPPETAIR